MSKADPILVRRALDAARTQRNQIVRGAPLPIDTAHLVGACVQCGRIAATVLGFPDPPYAGPQGQPRYRNAKELRKFLEELVQRPPQMPAPTDKDNGRACECGAPADPREVQGVRFMHAMPGAGAEMIVEGVRGQGSLLVSAAGSPLGAQGEFTWKMLRAPIDGVESDVGDGFDDAAIEKAFGRPVTLAHTWSKLLNAAIEGKESLEQVEPGYWIYAGPKADAGLAARIEALTKDQPSRIAHEIVSLGEKAPMPAGPAWPQWAYEHAEKLDKEELRAGIVMDLNVVRQSLVAQLGRLNLNLREEQNGEVLVASLGPAGWPVEVLIVALGAAHLGWTMAETVAAAVGEAGARAQALADFFAGAKKVRPEIEWKIDRMFATPVRKDGKNGRPINLLMTPFRFRPGTPEFDREIRFSTDELGKGTDVTKQCACGAKAFVAARLFPWQVVEDFKKATGGKGPLVVETYTGSNGQPRAALLAVVSDDMHVQVLGQQEFEGAGVTADSLGKRLAADLHSSLFAVDVSMHEDKDKKRALLAYGPLVASVGVNDHLVAALHEACGKPLRGDTASAQATTPNVFVLYEEGFDDDMLDKVLEMGQMGDGIGPDAPTPFSLEWDDVSLTAAAVGRFVNLTPPPQDPNNPQPPQGAPQPPQRAPARAR